MCLADNECGSYLWDLELRGVSVDCIGLAGANAWSLGLLGSYGGVSCKHCPRVVIARPARLCACPLFCCMSRGKVCPSNFYSY